MNLALTTASGIAAILVVATIIRLGRGEGKRLARVILPLATALLIVQIGLQHWPLTAFALLASMIVSAGALAIRGGGYHHGKTWIALAIFAASGLAGGFGLLAQALCAAGGTYGCAGTGPDLLAIVGWAIALTAYAYLAWRALRQ